MIAIACSKQSRPAAATEKTYPMTATIVSRDPAENTVNLDNKEVPGVMEAMKMDYALRGAKVSSLPPDGTAVDVTLHEQDGRYWVTDVRKR
jgi:copper binding protein CusF